MDEGIVPPGPRRVREVTYRVTPDALGNDVARERRVQESVLLPDGALVTSVTEREGYLACGCADAVTPRVLCHAPCDAIVCEAHGRACGRCGFVFCPTHAQGAPRAEGSAPWTCAGCYDAVFPPSLLESLRRFLGGRRRR